VDILHIHELWHYPAFAAAKVARHLTKPYVVSTHGELQTNFFRRKLYKKWPYWLAIQRPILQRAAFVHVMNGREHDDAIKRGVRSRVILIPNGVDQDLFGGVLSGARQRFVELHPEVGDKTIVLYMGRVAQIKRIELLIGAVAQANAISTHPQFHLVIFGPEAPDYGAKLRSLVVERNIADSITFGGAVGGQLRLDAYIAADIYAQASEAEGSSMSLLEAGSLGLPIVVTEGCEFPAEEYGIGIVAGESTNEFAGALIRVSHEKRSGTLPSPQALARFRSDHTWDNVAAQFKVLYGKAIASSHALPT
jgi:glycosyltransferase involved in cell wall biosynthesis